MEPVKFVALDRDDLEVVSTHLQDALVKVADVMWRPQEKRLVIALNRFDWLSAEGTKPELRRCRAALRFERVKCCKCRNVNPAGKDAVLNLLASNAWKPSLPIWGRPGRRACVQSILTEPPTPGVDGFFQPRH